ncbi:MAG: carboxylating nicotinate-nucleotide diphosphorylase [Anaerolineales bacterium]|jgi:nicotinate-nucleotide pyrophosphorylase (carboxylating)|nr:carboxylating nicotinate-nucleotide diphosphorylase [Anaerolineales bacterium]
MPVTDLSPEIREIIQRSLAEDIGDGDITSQATVPDSLWLTGRMVARAEGIIAGLSVAKLVFHSLDQRVEFETLVSDGQVVSPLQTLARLRGPGQALLTGERTALNLLQRMSGIATATQRYVKAVEDTRAVILDTRKTAPGLRILDKLAVTLGGGQNHRTGLYDMALIKNNHIAAVGGDLAEAVQRVRAFDSRHRPIEIEVRSLIELSQALELPVDRILLDNMTLDQLSQAVQMAAGRIPLEASGGVNLSSVADIARTGVDFISVGALTHSVQALDISLWIDDQPA